MPEQSGREDGGAAPRANRTLTITDNKNDGTNPLPIFLSGSHVQLGRYEANRCSLAQVCGHDGGWAIRDGPADPGLVGGDGRGGDDDHSGQPAGHRSRAGDRLGQHARFVQRVPGQSLCRLCRPRVLNGNANSNPATNTNIYLVTSTDGGQTWSSPVLVNDDVATTDGYSQPGHQRPAAVHARDRGGPGDRDLVRRRGATCATT